VYPGLVGAPSGTHFRDNDQPIRIRMECLLDDLIGHVRAVVVARVDMIHTRFNGFSQNHDSLIGIARRSPHLRTRQLHRAITHASNRHRRIREREHSAEIGLSDHLLVPPLCSNVWFVSKLTSRREFGKTELVSVWLDYRTRSPVASFLPMATKRSKSHIRKPRADGERNRERVLDAAKEAFTRSGADASLDDIAKQAGVGPGTLYRHFRSREALIEAVYRTEVEKLAAAQRSFAETMPPIEALRAWMLLFVDYIAAKKIIAPALNALIGDPKKVFEASYTQVWEAIRALVKRAVKSGDIRKDLDPIDLLRALIGVANVSSSPDWQQSARRLVEILILGARPVQ
jgi:AcrR family transcriptional regulator